MKKYLPLLILLATVSRVAGQIEVVSNGNVGVGTTSPGVKLEVSKDASYGDYTTSALHISNATTPAKAIRAGYDSAIDAGYFQAAHTGVAIKPLLLNPNGGNVGIGTLSPAQKLEVVGRARTGDGTNSIEILGGSSGGLTAGHIGTVNNVPLAFYTNYSAPQLTLTTAGAVGIGTTSPAGRLEVLGGNGTYIYSTSTQSGYTWAGFYMKGYGGSNSLSWAIHGGSLTGGADNQFGIYDSTAGATRLRITGAGDVGIGTTSPSHKLQVVGSVRATSFISDTQTYADFVFKPDYRLPALSEVEAHIRDHGHLPGIPSEAEARERGIDLARMQVQLLQKIEELTLHQIAQEKRLNDQSARLRNLETENASLRAALAR
jgi:hypothetical protein